MVVKTGPDRPVRLVEPRTEPLSGSKDHENRLVKELSKTEKTGQKPAKIGKNG